MRQASRRSWRIGQTQSVRVVFMSYRGTLQADALKLVAKKLQSSLAIEGELPEDGLAAFGDDGDDLMMALARRIVSGEEEGADRNFPDDQFGHLMQQRRIGPLSTGGDRRVASRVRQADHLYVVVREKVRDGRGLRAGAVGHHPQEGDSLLPEVLELNVERHEVAVVAHHRYEPGGISDEVGNGVDGDRDIRRILGVGAGEVLYTSNGYGQIGKATAGPYVPERYPVGPDVEVQTRQGRSFLRPLPYDGLDEELGTALEILRVDVQGGRGGPGFHRGPGGRSRRLLGVDELSEWTEHSYPLQLCVFTAYSTDAILRTGCHAVATAAGDGYGRTGMEEKAAEVRASH